MFIAQTASGALSAEARELEADARASNVKARATSNQRKFWLISEPPPHQTRGSAGARRDESCNRWPQSADVVAQRDNASAATPLRIGCASDPRPHSTRRNSHLSSRHCGEIPVGTSLTKTAAQTAVVGSHPSPD